MHSWFALLLVPFGLWLAFCLLRGSLGLRSCCFCRLRWFAVLAVVALCLLWSGLTAGADLLIAAGVIMLVADAIILATFYFSGRLTEPQRRSEPSEFLAADLLTSRGGRARAHDADPAPDGDGDGDVDGDVDLDLDLDP